MKPWEIAGVCVAVAIGAAVGAAYIMIDKINDYILDEHGVEWG